MLDEGHRAVGNFSYVNIVKSLNQSKAAVRLIGLSATPGNNITKIQEVITNLCVSKLETKHEEDEDIKPYVYSRMVKEEIIHESSGVGTLDELLRQVIVHISNKALLNREFIEPIKALIQKVAKLACEDITAMYQKLIGYQDTFLKMVSKGNEIDCEVRDLIVDFA